MSRKVTKLPPPHYIVDFQWITPESFSFPHYCRINSSRQTAIVRPDIYICMKYPIIATIMWLVASISMSAQNLGIKTNLLYDATLTINAGVEMQIAPKWTLDISGNLNLWTLSDQRRWKHWMLQPEARYWLCEPTHGHFFAGHLIGGQFNAGAWPMKSGWLGRMHDNRYQGWGAGLGAGYGYSWILGRHWNLEAEIGLGYIFRRYDKYQCAGCGKKIKSGQNGHYFGPTKAAINIVYVF